MLLITMTTMIMIVSAGSTRPSPVLFVLLELVQDARGDRALDQHVSRHPLRLAAPAVPMGQELDLACRGVVAGCSPGGSVRCYWKE